MSEIVTTPAIARAEKVLNLTPWGKIRLRVFEDEAINHALDVLESAYGVRDRFGFFFSSAVKYSNDKRIWLNDKRFLMLKEAYGMPDNAKLFFEENEKNLKGEKVSYKTKKNIIGSQAYDPRKDDPEYIRCSEMSKRKDAEWEETKRIAEQKRQEYWSGHQKTIEELSTNDSFKSKNDLEELPF